MFKQFDINNICVKFMSVRLDKYLWACRFYKTRSLSRSVVASGKVKYNGQACKPSKIVELGAVIRVPAGFDYKEVVVKSISDQRGKSEVAQTLYEETPKSIEQRLKDQEARKLSAFHSPRPDQKPSKKQRRELIKLKVQ
ncbi:MAG: heat-shock protein [Alteromonas sp. TMED35]|nr:MAG: heat-shock protein [Alteromonas sp. TMED35]|tara:strand:+ start:9375 stop:9791 length:417 start_codon:yes stop_codon:yes gene_type:complete